MRISLSPAGFILLIIGLVFPTLGRGAGGGGGHGQGGEGVVFPVPLSAYEAAEKEMTGLVEVLAHRALADPFNLVASVLFLVAILHTFAAGYFRKLAHHFQHEHEERMRVMEKQGTAPWQASGGKQPVSFWGECFHYLGEVEAVFGIWVVPLVLAIIGFHGWDAVLAYFDHGVSYVEPMFVVVIMAIASTRPVLRFSEILMAQAAAAGKHSPAAWWFSILTFAPLLGSFITEPAAITIGALLLAKQFYVLEPSAKLSYATIGLLFVNVSVGGTLTHFAAPPVLMVAGTWGWDMVYMFTHFGDKAALGIVLSNVIYFLAFRKEFGELKGKAVRYRELEGGGEPEGRVPWGITLTHLLFLAWTVLTLHHPPMFIGAFLIFLAFHSMTAHHQTVMSIKSPLLVGFFLAGLVTHGGLQKWWIAPVLSSLGELPLFIGATVLTAFNDNAAITFLASLVPAFDAGSFEPGSPAYETARALQFAVVAGAVTGGGLTVIANAPNPAGQAILNKFFKGGVSPLGLFMGALMPTVVVALCFLLLPR